MSYEQINKYLEKNFSGNIYPEVPLVHGFCFGIKKKVIDKIGYFDSKNLIGIMAEENDYCLRAGLEGFRFLIATNTFVSQ